MWRKKINLFEDLFFDTFQGSLRRRTVKGSFDLSAESIFWRKNGANPS
jgi:hypothetical protein